MKVLVEFITISEVPDLYEKSMYFTKKISNCKVDYIHKGEYRKYEDGKLSKHPIKNSVLTIANENLDYNNTIIKMLSVYEDLLEFFNQIEHDTYINISFYSNDMFSLEFGVEVLGLLKKHNFSLPVSCYREN